MQFLTEAFGSNAIIPVDEVIEVPCHEMSVAADNFEAAFKSPHFNVSYEEVRPLVNTNLVNHNFTNEGEDTISVAEGLLKIFGGKDKELELKDHWSEKKKAKRIKRHEENIELRANFVSKWRSRLGFIGGYIQLSEEFANECNTLVAENPLLSAFKYCAGYELVQGSKTKFGRKDNRKIIENGRGLPTVLNLGELVLAIMVRATQGLTSEEKIDLVCELDALDTLNSHEMTKTSDGLGVIIENYMFNLGDATITRVEEDGSKGRVRKAIKVVMYSDNFCVAGDTAIFVWILNSMRLSAKGMAQAINMSSNCFEEVINYGAVPGSEDMKYHVMKNMLKEASITCPNMSFFPYSNLSNKKLSVTTLNYCLSRGVHAMCDKQNKSWVAIGAGAEAMFVGRDSEGYLINLNDMGKMTKLFNRPAANVYQWAELI